MSGSKLEDLAEKKCVAGPVVTRAQAKRKECKRLCQVSTRVSEGFDSEKMFRSRREMDH